MIATASPGSSPRAARPPRDCARLRRELAVGERLRVLVVVEQRDVRRARGWRATCQSSTSMSVAAVARLLDASAAGVAAGALCRLERDAAATARASARSRSRGVRASATKRLPGSRTSKARSMRITSSTRARLSMPRSRSSSSSSATARRGAAAQLGEHLGDDAGQALAGGLRTKFLDGAHAAQKH